MEASGCLGPGWTAESAKKLQESLDSVFDKDRADELSQLRFSFTLADPQQSDCPLVCCSSGFMEMCGYGVSDIIGRNCRFLIDPVPADFVDAAVRQQARDFCDAVRDGREYSVPDEKLSWRPPGRASDDGLFCIQTNARQNSSLFKNVFYLKRIELNEKPFIVGLQTELPCNSTTGALDVPEEVCHKACRYLADNMAQAEGLLASMFWYTSPMRRQDDTDHSDGFLAEA
eukprot:TRINITY_DN18445_c0_g1_i1.p1 TRINITY_DN18445_c0_g1~~TRINITY_DN18445_c0_g1_i1.p1  ORF type:complete len:229 (-),score=40.33 TRINITY_DN18445_c0_g1_i1:30-716(-)